MSDFLVPVEDYFTPAVTNQMFTDHIQKQGITETP